MRTSSNPAKWNRQMSLDDLVRLHWRSGHDATEKWNASNGAMPESGRAAASVIAAPGPMHRYA